MLTMPTTPMPSVNSRSVRRLPSTVGSVVDTGQRVSFMRLLVVVGPASRRRRGHRTSTWETSTALFP